MTGETGHEIELEVDGAVFKLTRLFISSTGDYRQGEVEFPLPALEPGVYTLRLKAWDSFNNPARTEVQVRIVEEPEGLLSKLLFHPNPMRAEGHFTYQLAEPVAEVQIRVFSLSGRLVDQLEGGTQVGYNQVAWMPPSSLANGAYLYCIEVPSQGVEQAVVQVVR